MAIDEQHRFGVLQRKRLMDKAAAHGHAPHVLVLTATPIPRTLSLTLYGDLDVSVLDELPPGRTPISTRMTTEPHLPGVWEFLRREVAAGHQGYIVYPVIEESKLELIGTLAKRAEKEDVETFLVTSDKDFMQLVSPTVKLYRPGKGGNDDEIVDESGVMEKFGVPPEQVIEILGLIGDQSDNVPGVAGVGPKTAEPLIKKYGTIENLLAHIDEIPQKGLQEKLRSSKKMALLSKKLVTIEINAPVTIDFHQLKSAEKNVPALHALYTALEFRSLARRQRRMDQNPPPGTSVDPQTLPLHDITSTSHEYIIVDSDAKYLRMISELKKAKEFVFDTETTSTDALQAHIVGLSFCFEPKKAYYVPVRVKRVAPSEDASLFEPSKKTAKRSNEKSFQLEKLIADIKPVFENEKIKSTGQNT